MPETRVLNEASIPNSYSRLLAQDMGLQTAELPRLLAGTALGVEDFLDESTRLTARQQIQMLENALKLNDSADFGLRLGRRLTPAAHGPMGYLASSSPNLLAALQAVCAFVPTRMSFVHLQLRQSAGQVTLQFFFDISMSADAHRCIAEICVMTLFAATEFIIGRPATEVHTQFEHADPGPDANYAKYLPGCVRFNCQHTAVTLPLGLCQIPNASANHDSYAVARSQCEAILADLQSDADSYQRRIVTMMLSVPATSLSEEQAAASLCISKRTLARHLKAEGTSFRQLKDEILARQAKSYLAEGQLSVEAIASLLGYHDSANFRRAFKRWCGMSPNGYRNTQTS